MGHGRAGTGADGGGTGGGQIQGEQRRISAIYFVAVEILLHIHVEDFITHPWIPRTHFWDFI